ncbi:MAG: hypothetical protein DWQ49_09470 [Bacteroidetes bacterium]|nr:MAG: hypothetical protein DWQ49_09470 [Bacteroidota bacterium]
MPRSKKRADNSPYVHQRRKVELDLKIGELPWTPKQMEFIRLAQMKETKVMFVSGPAGVSKTILAAYCALHFLNDKKVSDILYLRSVVESSTSKMGFLPGLIEEKISPYLQPLMDKLDELLYKPDVKKITDSGRVDGRPINYLRGAHWAGKCVVLDEAQNCDKKELTTIMTRIGEFCKVFILGDPMQSDINGRTAFEPFCEAFDSIEAQERGIHVFRFSTEDIVRSEILKYIVSIIDEI